MFAYSWLICIIIWEAFILKNCEILISITVLPCTMFESVCVFEGNGVQNHLLPFQNLCNFVHPTLPMSFGRDTKSRWSLLPGVYARGSKQSHRGSKCVTCCGLKKWWSLSLTYQFPACERRRAGLKTLLRSPVLDRKKMEYVSHGLFRVKSTNIQQISKVDVLEYV